MGLRTNNQEAEIKTEVIRAGVRHIIEITYIYLLFDADALSQN